ncbi:MAG: copper amine oxidase N-terminal domain-containing protein [Clostridiales bacterium]|nr:copper amine oxidase N-terminal domain-containing protein [Clostridiales bacterium]
MKRNLKEKFGIRKRTAAAAEIMTAIVISSMTLGSALTAYAAAASDLAAEQVNTNYRTDNIQEGQNFRVYLNGENVTYNFVGHTPIMVTDEGRTLLPLRPLGSLLGADVDWDSDNKVAILTIDEKTLEVPIGSTNIIIDGSSQQIDDEGTQAVILDYYTYLPFRAVAEACGAAVDYQTGSDGSKNIYLTTSGSTGEVTPVPDTITGDPKLAAIGIYSAIDMGYDANNGPDESSKYYWSYTKTVNGFKAVGLTDEQINDNLAQIYLAPGGDGSTTATMEQEEHYITVGENITYTPKPDYSGDYRGQIVGYYAWTGSGWTMCTTDVAGLLGVGLTMSY